MSKSLFLILLFYVFKLSKSMVREDFIKKTPLLLDHPPIYEN